MYALFNVIYLSQVSSMYFKNSDDDDDNTETNDSAETSLCDSVVPPSDEEEIDSPSIGSLNNYARGQHHTGNLSPLHRAIESFRAREHRQPSPQRDEETPHDISGHTPNESVILDRGEEKESAAAELPPVSASITHTAPCDAEVLTIDELKQRLLAAADSGNSEELEHFHTLLKAQIYRMPVPKLTNPPVRETEGMDDLTKTVVRAMNQGISEGIQHLESVINYVHSIIDLLGAHNRDLYWCKQKCACGAFSETISSQRNRKITQESHKFVSKLAEERHRKQVAREKAEDAAKKREEKKKENRKLAKKLAKKLGKEAQQKLPSPSTPQHLLAPSPIPIGSSTPIPPVRSSEASQSFQVSVELHHPPQSSLSSAAPHSSVSSIAPQCSSTSIPQSAAPHSSVSSTAPQSSSSSIPQSAAPHSSASSTAPQSSSSSIAQSSSEVSNEERTEKMKRKKNKKHPKEKESKRSRNDPQFKRPRNPPQLPTLGPFKLPQASYQEEHTIDSKKMMLDHVATGEILCPHCKDVVKVDNFTAHYMRLHSNKKFVCPVEGCMKQYSGKNDCKRH